MARYDRILRRWFFWAKSIHYRPSLPDPRLWNKTIDRYHCVVGSFAVLWKRLTTYKPGARFQHGVIDSDAMRCNNKCQTVIEF